MAIVIDTVGWVFDERDGKEKFRIVIECESKKDVPDFPVSWIGQPIKVVIMLPETD